MAPAQETDILLLDEPTSLLDVGHQIDVLDLLTDLNERHGTTIVMVHLALEIHDTLAQHLIAIITQLDGAARSDDPATTSRHPDRAIRLARESLTEARRSVQALAPHQLTHLSLADAVRELVTDCIVPERARGVTGVSVELLEALCGSEVGDRREAVGSVDVGACR